MGSNRVKPATLLTGMADTYHVLIIDDDLAQAEMVSEFLGIAGYQQVDHTTIFKAPGSA